MSHMAEAVAWDSQDAQALPHGLRLLLLRIAYIVNPENDWLLWASPRALAETTGLTVSSVRTMLRRLVAEDWLEIAEVGAPGRPSTYRWVANGGSRVANGGSRVANGGSDAPLSTQSELNPTEEQSSSGQLELAQDVPVPQSKTKSKPFEDDFSECWEHYPGKRGSRAEALAQYQARRRAGVSAGELLAATRNYAAVRRGRDHTYTMHGRRFYGAKEPWREYVDGSELMAEAAAAARWPASAHLTDDQFVALDPLISESIDPDRFLELVDNPNVIDTTGRELP